MQIKVKEATPEEKANQLKEEGNKLFLAKKYSEAATIYEEALKLAPTNHLLFSNRSACFALLGKHKEALADAEATILLAPTFAKGYHRKGMALKALKDYPGAIEAIGKGIEVEANEVTKAQWRKDLEALAQLAKGNDQVSLLMEFCHVDAKVAERVLEEEDGDLILTALKILDGNLNPNMADV